MGGKSSGAPVRGSPEIEQTQNIANKQTKKIYNQTYLSGGLWEELEDHCCIHGEGSESAPAHPGRRQLHDPEVEMCLYIHD